MKFLKNNRILEISDGDPNDAEELLAYLKQVGGESNNLILDENGVNLTVEQEREYLRKAKDNYLNKIFIGKVDGKIVSDCGVHGVMNKRLDHNVTLGISVRKDYWNLGIGGYMMEHILNYCRMEERIMVVRLEVRPDNQYAVSLYQKVGFQKIGTYHKKVKINDEFIDQDIYELIL